MVALPTATIQNLLPLAIKRSEKYRAFNQIRNIRIRTLFAAFSVFINDRQLTDAKKALDTAKTLLHDSDDLTNAAMLLFYAVGITSSPISLKLAGSCAIRLLAWHTSLISLNKNNSCVIH
ncbi:hypothetical protein RNZ42_05270 [Lacticaseibacillus paracasei]|nr:hypothetical protein RNZ42_05270 [Lacticaseibacillus paracasei]